MTDVEIGEIQADIREQAPLLKEILPQPQPQPDFTRLIRETTAREAWRAARLSAE